MFRPKATSLGSKKMISEVMESLHDIHSLVKLEEYDDVKEAVLNLRPELMPRERTLQEDSSDAGSDDDFTKRLMS